MSVRLQAETIAPTSTARVGNSAFAFARWSRSDGTANIPAVRPKLIPIVFAQAGDPVANNLVASLALSLTGFGAFAVNLTCALMLMRFSAHSGSLTKAAFLSARNDVLANIAIIAAGLITATTVSAWPDLIVGLGIFVINLDAAREVFVAAQKERRTRPEP